MASAPGRQVANVGKETVKDPRPDVMEPGNGCVVNGASHEPFEEGPQLLADGAKCFDVIVKGLIVAGHHPFSNDRVDSGAPSFGTVIVVPGILGGPDMPVVVDESIDESV